MDCRRAQLLLLESDDPRPAHCASPELAEHLRHCAACRRLAGRVAQLEEAWRLQPVPAEAEQACEAFLQRVARHPALVRRRAQSWRTVSVRWAAAAVLLLAVGMGSLMFVPVPPAQAAPDLVERLVAWNLEIAEAPTLAERTRIHAERTEDLVRALEHPALPAEDRQLARKLLEAGGQLSREADPLNEADQLGEVSDLLVERMRKAAERGNDKLVNRHAQQYQRLTEHGLAPRLRQVEAAGAVAPDRRQQLERFAEREARRLQRLEKMAEKAPKGAQKELKKAVDGMHKQQKKRKEKGTP